MNNTGINKLEPYLHFDGRCEEAIEFYRKHLGAEAVMLMRFKESPDQSMVPPGAGNKIMHASLRIGGSSLMVSDGRCGGHENFRGFALCLSMRSEADADRTFVALAEGGQVQVPLAKTFFSPRFGMVADRFGVGWMVIVEAQHN